MRQRSAIAAISLAALALAGCTSSSSSSGTTTSPAAALSSSAAPTTADATTSAPAETASPTETPSPSTSATSSDLASVMRGAADASTSAGSARVSMTVSSAGGADISAKGVIQWKGGLAGDITMTLSVQGQDVPIRELLTPTAFYINFGGKLGAQMPKPWMKISLKDVGALSGIDLSQIADQANQADPSQQLAVLAAAGSITEVGQEDVGGQPATHYKGTADIGKLSAGKGVTPKMIEILKKAGIKTIDYDLWLNGDKLPVKYVSTSTIGGKTSTTTVLYSDFGIAVHVKVPPASQVTDLGKQLGSLPKPKSA